MFIKKLSLIPIYTATAILFTACTDGVDMDKYIQKVSKNGSVLPYKVLSEEKDFLEGNSFEIRNGGYGSDMVAHPSIANQFYAITDRGPNASYNGSLGKGKMFPSPDYTPRIGLFQLQSDGSIKLLKEILLKKPDGTYISGLPNSSSLGGTGETPYNSKGEVIRMDMSKEYNKIDNPIKLDDYGLDAEGLVALKDGTFWLSDEYGPHMVHFDKDGKEIERINAFKYDKRVKVNLPQEFANRRANRGMEGLAISKDESTLVGIMQSTLYNPSKEVKNLDITRIVAINPVSGKIAQYLYKQNKTQNSNSGIVAFEKNKFYVIERDGSFYKGGPKKANVNAQKHIYGIDLISGTNLEEVKETKNIIQDEKLGLLIEGKTLEQFIKTEGWEKLKNYGIKPVDKKLVVDMVKEFEYPHDKMEGLWVINDNYLGVINDDDFATWSTKGKLHAKKLGTGKIDSNTLYIVKLKK